MTWISLEIPKNVNEYNVYILYIHIIHILYYTAMFVDCKNKYLFSSET